MAKSTSKPGKIRQFPKGDPPEPTIPVAATPPEPTPPPETPPQPAKPTPEPPRRGRPPAAANQTPKAITFFGRMAAIPATDWTEGRARIKVYRLQPLMNQLIGSEHKYITIYDAPITEQTLKVDHGSGRYRLYLVYRAPAGAVERELDKIELDILDPSYPPKIPPGAWIDDPRNKQWAWARPPGAPGGPELPPKTALSEVADTFDTFVSIQERLKENMQPPPAPPAPPAAPAVDPWAAAEKILNMRSDNPMVTFMMEQLKTTNASIEASRQREYQLQKDMLDAAKAATLEAARPKEPDKTPAKTLIEQVKEAKEILSTLGVPIGNENGGPARAGKMGMLEFLQGVLPQLANAPILNSLAIRLLQAGISGPAPSAMQPHAAAQPGQRPMPQDPLMSFVEFVTPTMLSFLEADEDNGSAFAGWVYEGFPERLGQLQTVVHPQMPAQSGAPVIISLYRQSPYWGRIQLHEARFNKFVEDFCKWKPDTTIDAEIIDSEHQEAEDAEPERIDV